MSGGSGARAELGRGASVGCCAHAEGKKGAEGVGLAWERAEGVGRSRDRPGKSGSSGSAGPRVGKETGPPGEVGRGLVWVEFG